MIERSDKRLMAMGAMRNLITTSTKQLESLAEEMKLEDIREVFMPLLKETVVFNGEDGGLTYQYYLELNHYLVNQKREAAKNLT